MAGPREAHQLGRFQWVSVQGTRSHRWRNSFCKPDPDPEPWATIPHRGRYAPRFRRATLFLRKGMSRVKSLISRRSALPGVLRPLARLLAGGIPALQHVSAAESDEEQSRSATRLSRSRNRQRRALLSIFGLGIFLTAVLPPCVGQSGETRIPAYTAFVEPNPEGVQVAEESGISGWTNPRMRVFWVGKFAAKGKLHVSLSLRLPAGDSSRLRLTVAKKVQTAQATSNGTQPASVSFGTVDIPAPGYYRITLEGLSKAGKTFGEVEALVLSGPAMQGAHFNLRPEQRGAPSVHLTYPLPKETQAAWFYNEVTVKTDPVASYYMACGWHRGYFGIQVNSPTERRIIFSVWDSGSEAVDRAKVAEDDQVRMLARGKDVYVSSFGNEGTGGHSHLVYPWKKGHTYRFLVTATPSGTATIYSGYFFFPEKQQWGLIASFRAPKDGSSMRGLYSFNEDFWGANGYLYRRAEFGPAWAKSVEGTWTELTTARFTHTGKEWRTDYDAGAVKDRFYLACGGFRDGKVKYGDTVKRPASGHQPPNIPLPLPTGQ